MNLCSELNVPSHRLKHLKSLSKSTKLRSDRMRETVAKRLSRDISGGGRIGGRSGWGRRASLVGRLVRRSVLGTDIRAWLGQNDRLREFRGYVAAEQIAAAGARLSIVGLKRTVGEHLHSLVTGGARMAIDLKHIVSAAIERFGLPLFRNHLGEMGWHLGVLDILKRILAGADPGDRTESAFVGLEFPNRNAAIESHYRLGMRRVARMVGDHVGAEEFDHRRARECVAGTPVADRDVG